MPDPDWHGHARSALQRGREELTDLLHACAGGHTRSKLISQAQTVAQYCLRAILYARGIRVGKTHELQEISERWRGRLVDIRQELEPLLHDYGWLYPQRLIADYQHADAPTMQDHPAVDHPPIGDESVERALEAARQFCALAERS
jgi:HEPN domain-containing protein